MSYARIDAKRVQEACKSYLLRRNKRIEEEQENLIQAEMERRFFRAKTREDAIERLSSDCWSDYNRVQFSGSYWSDKVEGVLKLAKESDDGFVIVDEGIVSVLFK